MCARVCRFHRSACSVAFFEFEQRHTHTEEEEEKTAEATTAATITAVTISLEPPSIVAGISSVWFIWCGWSFTYHSLVHVQ